MPAICLELNSFTFVVQVYGICFVCKKPLNFQYNKLDKKDTK